MSSRAAEAGPAGELDVRRTPRPERHQAVFAAFEELPVGGSFVLVSDHEPERLRQEFEARHPRGHGWERLGGGPRERRTRITRLAETPLPRVVADTAALAAAVGEAGVGGAVWRLEAGERDLDANVIALPPGDAVEPHTGPDVDVLVHVLAGGGSLATELDVIELEAGTLLWLPRGSRRGFAAGPKGLRYLTVHRKRRALVLGSAPPRRDMK